MIALEFTGKIAENAVVKRVGEMMRLVFQVTVIRFVKQSDGTMRPKYTTVCCTKNGTCAADAHFRKGQQIFVRGDVRIEKDDAGEPQLHCHVWQFELL